LWFLSLQFNLKLPDAVDEYYAIKDKVRAIMQDGMMQSFFMDVYAYNWSLVSVLLPTGDRSWVGTGKGVFRGIFGWPLLLPLQ